MSNYAENSADLNAQNQQKPLYFSQRAVLAFAILFSPLGGGLLLRQNLLDSGNKADANKVLLGSIGILLVQILIPSIVTSKNAVGIGFWVGVVATYFLYKSFSKKYITDEAAYTKKPIWKAFIIGLLITIPIVFLLGYLGYI